MKKVTRAQMNKVAIEINGIMEIDPKIPTKGSATDVQVKKGIKKAVALMEKGDKITESTRDVILDMEFDLSADVKVIKDKKEISSKPAATKKATTKPVTTKKAAPKETQKPAVKKAPTKTKAPAEKKPLNVIWEQYKILVEKNKFNRKEIKEKLLVKFPDKTTKQISDILSYSTNPKYTKFDSIVVPNKEGILIFKKLK